MATSVFMPFQWSIGSKSDFRRRRVVLRQLPSCRPIPRASRRIRWN